MAITAQDVNKLRQMTGAGMMDCKKALTEANGDFDGAVEILRKKGQKVSAARADRETTEGIVLIDDNGKEATLLAFGCETDFVARNEEFVALGKDILAAAVKEKPADKEALYALSVNGMPIQEKITEMIGKIGEKLHIVAYERVSGEATIGYVHSNGKLGVVVAFAGTEGKDISEVAKDVAMQIAAMNPVAIDKDDVDAEMVQKEIEIGKEQARNEGKAEELLEKIALGKLNRFYKDSTLLNQDFVKDNSKTVRQMLQSVAKNLTVTAFKRVSVG